MADEGMIGVGAGEGSVTVMEIVNPTVSFDVAVEDETPNVVMEVIVVSTSVDASVLLIAVAQASFHMIVLEGQEA
jgi:hypothetical protein